MYFWNKDNFQGLKHVGEQYNSKPGFELFAKYCFLKEKGLKKIALESINEFIHVSKNQTIDDQRLIASDLASLSFLNSDIHQLIPHPLQQYLLSVLKSWASEDRNDAAPHRWLGYIGGDMASFEMAVKICPTDDISNSRLALSEIKEVDYQTHHLSESRFIGELIDAKKSIEKATIYVKRIQITDTKNKLLSELEYYRSLLRAWEKYSEKEYPEIFLDWCKNNNYKFQFPTIAYYDE